MTESRWVQRGGALFAGAVVGLLLLMVLPLPTFMLDGLLAINIALALIILLVSIYQARPLDFSGFPALLLVATLFRLTLNIASTRLILLQANDGQAAAGRIIAAFGEIVVGGNYVVGVIVFVILVIINFVVITKGSGRIAEVGARFTLDAMPGKQMAIDADLNAGIISEQAARERRQNIEREADFYGAMDGASKFVRGDAIAGILITVINIIGGFIVGMTQHGMPALEAAETFTLLTVGDGLVSQIPALVISTAAGIIVTRAAGSSDLGSELVRQLFASRRVLLMCAGILFLFGLMPGMPTWIFASLAGVLAIAARGRGGVDSATDGRADGAASVSEGEPGEQDGEPETETDKIESLLPIDVLELEVGYGLISLVDQNQSGELLERIQSIRRQFASQMGVVIPPVHIRDNLQLAPGAYSLLLKGVSVANGELIPDRFMAMNPGDVVETMPGMETVEPAFGLPAIWIGDEQRDEAERLGYTVVDCATVVATHLSEVLRENAHELLGRQEAQGLIDVCAKQAPKVVEDLLPGKLELGDVLRVLKNLLREQLSIRDMRTILEALADHVHLTKNTEILTEFVRQRLARYISNKLKAPDEQIHVLTLNPTLEDGFRGHVQQLDGDFHLTVDPSLAEAFLQQLESQANQQSTMGFLPVLLVAPELRRPVRNLIERFMSSLTVISHKELVDGTPVVADGEVGTGLSPTPSPGPAAGAAAFRPSMA